MSKTFRACWSSYFVFTIGVSIPSAIAFSFVLRGDRIAVWVVAVGLATLLFAYYWLARFRLVITPYSLTYSSLYTGDRTVNFSEVIGSEMICRTGLYGWRYLLEVKTPNATTRINFKVFSREATVALFHLVGPNQSLEPTADRL